MTERAWKYGDVVRVDPVSQPQVKQPDDRRWMVVNVRHDEKPWTLLYIGPDGRLSTWSTMFGFLLVEPEEADELETRDDQIDADLGTGYIGEFS